MISTLLMDVEGTTTSISFVHEVLFPYSRDHLARFVAEHRDRPEVASQLRRAGATVAEETGAEPDAGEVTAALLRWIAEDRKHPALKALQGMIWEHGYTSGAYTAHLYEDVKPAWERWKSQGLTLAIYSSGSVQAQQLLFRHTRYGDLTPLLSHYFDTGSGPKKEAASYLNIANALHMKPEQVLFLSDVEAELDAAALAGMQTTQLVRPGTSAGSKHPVATDFTQIQLG